MEAEEEEDAFVWIGFPGTDPNPDAAWSILIESRLGLLERTEISLVLGGSEENGIFIKFLWVKLGEG